MENALCGCRDLVKLLRRVTYRQRDVVRWTLMEKASKNAGPLGAVLVSVLVLISGVRLSAGQTEVVDFYFAKVHGEYVLIYHRSARIARLANTDLSRYYAGRVHSGKRDKATGLVSVRPSVRPVFFPNVDAARTGRVYSNRPARGQHRRVQRIRCGRGQRGPANSRFSKANNEVRAVTSDRGFISTNFNHVSRIHFLCAAW